MSKIESIPVARRDNDSDEMAAYTKYTLHQRAEGTKNGGLNYFAVRIG